MAAAPHPLRDEAVATARNLCAFHGQEEGERLARANYAAAGVSKATISGWLKQARQPAEPPSVAVPASHSSGSIGGDGPHLDFAARIARIDAQAALIVSQCVVQVVDPATGEITQKARNLPMLAQAIRLQSAAAALVIKEAERALELAKIQQQLEETMDAFVAAIKAEPHETAQRVFERFSTAARVLDARFKGTAS